LKKKVNVKDIMKKYIMTIIGCALVGTESVFLIPHKIVTGGFAGIANILYNALNIPPGISVFVLNFLVLAISFKALGKKFVLDSIIGAGLLSGFIQLFMLLPPITENILLSTIFGCIISGAGAGLVLAAGATTGGTDIVARLIQIKASHWPIGKIMLSISVMIILSGLIVFKTVDLALYGFLATIIYAMVIDMVFKTLNNNNLLFIITSEQEKIVSVITSVFKRGVTVLDVKGGYSGEEKGMIMLAIKRKEIQGCHNAVLQCDPDAFVIISRSEEVHGNGFKVYK